MKNGKAYMKPMSKDIKVKQRYHLLSGSTTETRQAGVKNYTKQDYQYWEE